MTGNNGPSANDSGARTPPLIADNLRAGLALLWKASHYAQDAGAGPWDFALEIDELYDSGMTISDLHWLVAGGFAQHAQETSGYGDAHRSFQPTDGLNFTATTCFVLTPQGTEFVEKLRKESAAD